MGDDLAQRPQLPLARREARRLARLFGSVLVIAVVEILRLAAFRKLERQPVCGRPIVGAVLHLSFQTGQQRRLARAVGAAHVDASGRLRQDQVHRVVQRRDGVGPVAIAQHQLVELDARVERRIELGVRVCRDAAQPRPHRQEFVPPRGELVHVVRHLDLARQRRDQRDQRGRIADVMRSDVRQGAEHDGQAHNRARRAQAFLDHDRLDLRVETVAQLGLEAVQPEPQIVAVAGEDVVPGGVALRRHSVGHALVVQIGARDGFAHRPLHREQHGEGGGVGHRQRAVDLRSQHDHVENQAKQETQVAFDLVQQIEIDVERLAGEKRLDALAHLLLRQRLGLMPVFVGELQHVAPIGQKSGALGVDPADRAHDVR